MKRTLCLIILIPIANLLHSQNLFLNQKGSFADDKDVAIQENTRMRLALHGGYSYQVAKISDEVPAEDREHVKKLKSGYHLGADFSYFITETSGINMKYNYFNSSHEIINIIKNEISIDFIGPGYALRLQNYSKTNALFMCMSIGYMGYTNKRYGEQIKGNTFGTALDIGYDIGIAKNVALGLQFSMLSGSLKEFKITRNGHTETVELEKGQYEGLGRIDLTIGLRFNF